MDKSTENLKAAIKAAMKERKWKPKDLAKASGITRSGIYKIIHGHRFPGPDNLDRIAKAFGMRSGDLTGHTEPEKPTPTAEMLLKENERKDREIADKDATIRELQETVAQLKAGAQAPREGLSEEEQAFLERLRSAQPTLLADLAALDDDQLSDTAAFVERRLELRAATPQASRKPKKA